MKKIIGTILINILLSAIVMAQEEAATPEYTSNMSLTNKNGMAILPAGNDFALGADAAPFLAYIGNMNNGENYNSLEIYNQNIYGRYFLSMNTAIRANLYIDNSTSITRQYVQDDKAVLADPLSNEKLEDKRVGTSNDWNISAGIQKFRGYGRLQGFYGVTVGYGQSRTKYDYQYANQMTEANQNPTTTTNWNNGAESSQSIRTTYEDYGLSMDFFGGPVAGVEFYFAPKMCIGAELNIRYSVSLVSEADNTSEEFVDGSVFENINENTPNQIDRIFHSNGLGANGGLYLMFHF